MAALEGELWLNPPPVFGFVRLSEFMEPILTRGPTTLLHCFYVEIGSQSWNPEYGAPYLGLREGSQKRLCMWDSCLGPFLYPTLSSTPNSEIRVSQ